MLQEELATRQKILPPDSSSIAESHETLGNLYQETNRPKEAETAFRSAVSMYGKSVGGNHPDYANALESLALSYEARKDYASGAFAPARAADPPRHFSRRAPRRCRQL